MKDDRFKPYNFKRNNYIMSKFGRGIRWRIFEAVAGPSAAIIRSHRRRMHGAVSAGSDPVAMWKNLAG